MDVDSLSSEIGKGLQWLRKSLLLTQYQLASFTELDYRHYQNIETGRVEVKVETLKRICSTFGVGLSTFFFLLDRRPWLTDAPTRNKGSGDLYLFRILLEQACFRVIPSVRELLGKWGRDLAEGSRDTLNQSLFPCVETDLSLKVLWKNGAATTAWTAESEDEISIVEALDTKVLREEVDHFWTNKASSFYLEMPLNRDNKQSKAAFAVIGLRPMLSKVDSSVFLAFVKLGEADFAAGECVSLTNRKRVCAH
ncbi:MAG: XRE family transcriptional regulator [Proteobacteria bacterium]|nr:MAG: XRE family transcriptional regulator [Pseudomonadota bacterium]